MGPPFSSAMAPSSPGAEDSLSDVQRDLDFSSFSPRSTPRSLDKFQKVADHDLLHMQLREARKLEELMEQQAVNARWRRLRSQYYRGWVPLVFDHVCGKVEKRIAQRRRRNAFYDFKKKVADTKIVRLDDGRIEGFMRMRAVTCCNSNNKRRAWWSLLHASRQTRLRVAVFRMACNTWRHHSPLRSLNKWRPLGRRFAIVRHALRSLRAQSFRRAMNSWLELAELRCHKMRLLRHAVFFLQQRKLRAASNAWIEAAKNAAYHRQALRRGLSIFTLRMQRLVFNSYAAAAKRKRLALARLRFAAATFANTLMRVGWNSWFEHVRARCALQARRAACLAAMLHRQMRKASNSWIAFASQRAKALQVLRLGASIFIMGTTRRFWNSYVTIALANKRKEDAMRAVIARMRHRGLFLGFESWRQVRTDRRTSLRKAELAVSEWQEKGPRRAYFKWRAVSVVHTTLNAAMRSLVERGVRMGFNSWLALAQGRVAFFRKLRHGASIFITCTARRFWNEYSAIARANKRKDEAMRAIVARITNRGIALGFYSWLQLRTGRRTNLRKAELAVGEWQQKGPRRAYFKWQAQAAVYTKVKGATRSLVLRGVRMGFNSWLALAQGRATFFRALRRGASIFVFGTTRRFWNSYVAIALANKREHDATRAVIERMTHRGLFLGFDSWTGAWIERRTTLRKAERALSEWQQKGPRRAWFKWRSIAIVHSTLACAIRNLMDQQLRKALNCLITISENTKLKRRAIAAMSKRQLRMAHNTWDAHVCQRNDSLRKLRHGLSVFNNAVLRRFWNSYSAIAAANRHEQELMLMAATRLSFRALSLGFNGWAESSAEWQVSLRKVELALDEWQRKGPRRSFFKWCAVAAVSSKLKFGLANMVERGLRMGLNSWVAEAQAQQNRRRLLLSGAAALLNRQLRQGTTTWILYKQARRAHLVALARAVGAFSGRVQRRGLNQWLEFDDNARYAARVWAISKKGLRHGKQRMALATWRVVAAIRGDHLVKISQRVVSLSSREISHAWRTWRVDERSRYRERATIDLKLRFAALLGKSTCFRLWVRACQARHVVSKDALHSAMRASALHLLGQTARRQMSMAWTLWRSWTRVRGVFASRWKLKTVRERKRDGFRALRRAAISARLEIGRRALRENEELRKSLVLATSGEEALAAMAADLQKAFMERDALQEQVKRAQTEADKGASFAADEKQLTEAREKEKRRLTKALEEAQKRAAEAHDEAEEKVKERDVRIDALMKSLEDVRAQLAAQAAQGQAQSGSPGGLGLAVTSMQNGTANSTNVSTSTGITPVATLHVHLESEPQSLMSSPVEVFNSRSPASRSAPSSGRRSRASSPRPTAASRGWRMSFSPDWKHDADAAGWMESRRAMIGRTAAKHTPWVQSRSPPRVSEHHDTPSQYRRLKHELSAAERGMAAIPLPVPATDPNTRLEHRNGFAWSQHAFEGGHYKEDHR